MSVDSEDVVTVVRNRFREHAAAAKQATAEAGVPRLQTLGLPDGRFVLVVSGGGLLSDDHDTLLGLAESLGAADVAVFTQPIEVG